LREVDGRLATNVFRIPGVENRGCWLTSGNLLPGFAN
jgi:hypothetical protein